jgi:hypothetical protein
MTEALQLIEALPEPAVQIGASFNRVDDRGELILSTHVDTIQAMLLTTGDFPELEVMIKGRVGGQEEGRITADPLFRVFTQRRVERDKLLRESQITPAGLPTRRRLTVEEAADSEPFQCGFFDMNKLVRGLLKGEVNAAHLMINFGGATDLEIGSDTASRPQLEAYAAELVFQVHARQLGEVPNSILMKRLG